jgi:hypothetical protein
MPPIVRHSVYYRKRCRPSWSYDRATTTVVIEVHHTTIQRFKLAIVSPMEEGHELSVTSAGVGALFETKLTSQKRGVNSTALEITNQQCTRNPPPVRNRFKAQ